MRSFLTWLFSVCAVVLGLWAGSVGWHQVACAQGLSDAIGWGLLALVFSPFSFPPVGFAAIAISVFVPVALVARIQSSGASWPLVLWSLAAWSSAFVVCNTVARLTSAHARCSFGF
jgi:hypothetical protein